MSPVPSPDAALGCGNAPSVAFAVADDLVRPLRDRPAQVDREIVPLVSVGLYSGFLQHAEVGSARHGIGALGVLVEAGRRGWGDGGEGFITNVGLDLLSTQESQETQETAS